MSHLQLVFEVLLENQLYVKLAKCDFGATRIEYLDLVIGQGVVEMDDKKVNCMVEWHVPKFVKELRGFLGLTGYYRRFIRGYGSIAKPLTELLKKMDYYGFPRLNMFLKFLKLP